MRRQRVSLLSSSEVPATSIEQLTRDLVRIPSQGGVDPKEPVLSAIFDWLDKRALKPRLLPNQMGEAVAVLVELEGNSEGPEYCLNACADTAVVGASERWRFDPFSARVEGGWLYGRGSADSKCAVAIFCHMAASLAAFAEALNGTISFLFDADEHTGQFGGIAAYLEHRPEVSGVMIGYPGNHGVIVGARGFYRAQVRVTGTAAHSGTTKTGMANATHKAADLVLKLQNSELQSAPDPDFEFGPKLTVTAIHGGCGYSTIPDVCDVNIDVRLTRTFDSAAAKALITGVMDENNRKIASPRANAIVWEQTLPAYHLPTDSPVAHALIGGASLVMERDVPGVVCGPSNAGNFLADRGVEATCGFGVTYKNVHSADERIELASINRVSRAYLAAIEELLVTA